MYYHLFFHFSKYAYLHKYKVYTVYNLHRYMSESLLILLNLNNIIFLKLKVDTFYLYEII